MRYVYIVLSKDKDKRVTMHGAFTSQTKAWNLRDELKGEGYTVTAEKLTLNEEAHLLLSVWSYYKDEDEDII